MQTTEINFFTSSVTITQINYKFTTFITQFFSLEHMDIYMSIYPFSNHTDSNMFCTVFSLNSF